MVTCSPLKNEPLLMLILNFLSAGAGHLPKCYKFRQAGFMKPDKECIEAFALQRGTARQVPPSCLKDPPNYILKELWMIWKNMVPHLW